MSLSYASRSIVRMVVDGLHVSTPDDEVERIIRRKCTRWVRGDEALTVCIVRLALKRHADNRKLYEDVRGGRI